MVQTTRGKDCALNQTKVLINRTKVARFYLRMAGWVFTILISPRVEAEMRMKSSNLV